MFRRRDLIIQEPAWYVGVEIYCEVTPSGPLAIFLISMETAYRPAEIWEPVLFVFISLAVFRCRQRVSKWLSGRS